MPRRLRLVDGDLEEEAQRRHRRVDRRRVGADLGQVHLEGAQLLRRRGVRRAVEKSCELLDGTEILALCVGDEIAHRHVLDHASAQRADRLLRKCGGHRGLLSRGWRLRTPRSSRRPPRPVIAARLRGYPPTSISRRSPSGSTLSRESGFVL